MTKTLIISGANTSVNVVGTSGTAQEYTLIDVIYLGSITGDGTLQIFGINIPSQLLTVSFKATALYYSGAWTLISIGSVGTAFVNNANVVSGANIAVNKLAALAADEIPQINSSGFLEASGVASSFLALLGALNQSAANYNKAGAFSGATADLDLLAGAALAGLTQTELFYLIGVTSPIQSQLNAKANTADFSGILEIRSFNVLIPSAQVLDIFSNPVTIVPAQGANTIIVPISGQGQMIYGTTPYATDGEIDFYCGGSRPVMGFPADDGFLFGTVSRVVNAILALTSNPTDTQYVANQPLTLKTVGSNPTAGDSDIRVFGTYIVITL
jgi:hypothetical protein